jgi:hypothetical protein
MAILLRAGQMIWQMVLPSSIKDDQGKFDGIVVE